MSKDLVSAENNYSLVPMNNDIAESIKEELEGLGSLTFDFVKIPSGGGIAFEVPGDDGDDPDMVKELVGVIVDHHPVNCYWKDAYSGENTAPDCASVDGKTGIVAATGEVCNCADCPLNEFGSSESGGKACKNTHRVYLVRENEMLPVIISMPPTSLKPLKEYISKRIVLKGKHPYDVITKITLQKDKNAGGIVYSKAAFSKVGELTEQQRVDIAPTVAFVKSISRQATDFSNEAGDALPFDDK